MKWVKKNINKEILNLKEFYKEEMKNIHCFFRQDKEFNLILINVKDFRYEISNKGVFRIQLKNLKDNYIKKAITKQHKEIGQLIRNLHNYI